MSFWIVSATALTLFWLPGFLIVPRGARSPIADPIGRFALRIALGIALWPLALLWTSFAGIPWTSVGTRGAIAAIAVAGLFAAIRSGAPAPRPPRRLRLEWVILAGVVVLTVWTRLEHVRELAISPWVDPVHHTMIIRLIVDLGELPSTYAPYLPEARFYYHWGYHALVAFLAWTLGITGPFEIAALQLHFGQFLNALTPIVVYAAGRTLLGSRWAGVAAAALASLVSFYPAYYLSWGRYTHLTGVVLLPVLSAVLWEARRRTRMRTLGVLVLLASGLLLIHVRIALFAVTFGAALAALLMLRGRWRTPMIWGATALASAILVSPWFAAILGDSPARRILDPAAASDPQDWMAPAEVPPDILLAPRNPLLLSLASGGLTGMAGVFGMTIAGRAASLGWWIVLLGAAFRSRRAPHFTRRTGAGILLLGLWTALTAAVVLLTQAWATLPQIASPSSAVITAFLPASLAGGALLTWGARTLAGIRFRSVLALILTAGSLWGAWGMKTVVNPITVLATSADLEALRWITERTGDDAVFVAAARPWIGGSWVGADGGYWIGVLTGRRSFPPPALYRWGLPEDQVAEIHAAVGSLAMGDSSAESVERLRALGVTHLFVGEKSTPEFQAAVSRLETELLFQRRETRILRWTGRPAPRF